MAKQDVLAVVTGANRGIGLEVARQLARRGVRVVLTSRDPIAGKAAAEQVAAGGSRVMWHPLDVTEEASVRALRGHLTSEFGHLDVLVNNAGISLGEDRDGLDVDLETIRRTFETNTLAPLRLSQALVPLLARSRAARIVNMSSGMGAIGEMEGGHAAYRISKAALNAVTRILATELAGKHIAVNSMCPGWVRTDMGGAEAERDVSEGADTAVWLALEAPQRLTGGFYRDREPIAW